MRYWLADWEKVEGEEYVLEVERKSQWYDLLALRFGGKKIYGGCGKEWYRIPRGVNVESTVDIDMHGIEVKSRALKDALHGFWENISD